MSFINTLVLSFNCIEFEEDEDGCSTDVCQPLKKVNAWLKKRKCGPLSDLFGASDTGSGSNAVLYGGAYNKLDVEGFLAAVKKQKWQHPEDLQVLLWDDDSEKFSLITAAKPRMYRFE